MNPFSKSVYWLSVIGIFYASFSFYPKWKKEGTEATLAWDVCGYYYYLPAYFIYHDLEKVNFHPFLDKKYRYQDEYYASRLHEPTGNQVMKYTSGMAVMYAPAFFAAHFVAKPLGFEADGFSLPYQFAVSFWSVLVALLGLWYLRKVLLKLNFSDKTTAFTLFLTAFATNYLDYGFITGAMSHNYIFTLYAILLWQIIRFFELLSTPNATSRKGETIFRAIGIGTCIGLAALARPTELPVAMLPILWGVASFRSIGERLIFFKSHLSKILLAVGVCLAIGFLQFAYWKTMTGHFFYKSYGPEDWMEWSKPHFIDGLFSAKKGWLVYTPVMLFALFGFVPIYQKRRNLFWAIFLFFLTFIYVSFCHNIWWYGGSLGQRQMVQIYPILAIPLAAFLESALQNKIWRIVVLPAFAVCLYLNVWLVYQCHGGTDFELEETTPAFLRATYGRWNVPIDTKKLLDNKYDFKGEKQDVEIIYTNDFEQDTSQNIENKGIINGKKSLFVDKTRQFLSVCEIPLSNKGKKWLRATATFRTTEMERNAWKKAEFTLNFKKDGKIVKGFFLCPQRIVSENETKKIWLDVKISKLNFDKLNISLVNKKSDKTLIFDDLSVEIFNEK